MTGISIAIANRIFDEFGITFEKHHVAGYIARKKGVEDLHTPTLWEACREVVKTWFLIK